MVKFDQTPKVDFAHTTEPELPDPPHSRPMGAKRPVRSPYDTMAESFSSSFSAFPVSKLAPASSHQPQIPPSPTYTVASESAHSTATDVTTVAGAELDDSMDWTPTRPRDSGTDFSALSSAQLHSSGVLSSNVQPPPFTFNSASASGSSNPFHGTLPPAPKAPAHKILNPFAQPVFQRTPASSQKNFFRKMMVSQGTPAVLVNAEAAASRGGAGSAMQEAKFKYPEKTFTTGLESLLGGSLSIQDEHQGDAGLRTASSPNMHDGNDPAGSWRVSSSIYDLRLLIAAMVPAFIVIGYVWWLVNGPTE